MKTTIRESTSELTNGELATLINKEVVPLDIDPWDEFYGWGEATEPDYVLEDRACRSENRKWANEHWDEVEAYEQRKLIPKEY